MTVHLDMFRCEPYDATLLRTACALRWTRVNRGAKSARAEERANDSQARAKFGKCIGCPIGEAHVRGERAGETAEPPTPAVVHRAPTVSGPFVATFVDEEFFAPVEPAQEVERRESDMAEKPMQHQGPCAMCGNPFKATDGRRRSCDACRATLPAWRTKSRSKAPKAEPAKGTAPKPSTRQKLVREALERDQRETRKRKRAQPPKPRGIVVDDKLLQVIVPSAPAQALASVGFNVVGEFRYENRVLIAVDVGGGS